MKSIAEEKLKNQILMTKLVSQLLKGTGQKIRKLVTNL